MYVRTSVCDVKHPGVVALARRNSSTQALIIAFLRAERARSPLVLRSRALEPETRSWTLSEEPELFVKFKWSRSWSQMFRS